MKKLAINSGSAIMLNENTAVFDGYDKIIINCGSAVISNSLYAKLEEKDFIINCGSTKYVDVTAPITELPDNIKIGPGASYAGCWLFVDGTIIVLPGGDENLKTAAGGYCKRLIYPESADISAFTNITAESMLSYPDGAEILSGNIDLEPGYCYTLKENTVYWTRGNARALDRTALEVLKDKNITIHCKNLEIYEGLMKEFASLFNTQKLELIPDGHTITDDLTLDKTTLLAYGDKIFVKETFTMNPDSADFLKGITSIIVKGEAELEESAVETFRKVGKAQKYFLYSGMLKKINGQETINHEYLSPLVRDGVSLTIRVNGALSIADDVTPEDLGTVKAVYINGAALVPDNIRGIFGNLAKEVNGTIQSAGILDELGINPLKDNPDVTSINTGSFKA